jgi:hypothetical protein
MLEKSYLQQLEQEDAKNKKKRCRALFVQNNNFIVTSADQHSSEPNSALRSKL